MNAQIEISQQILTDAMSQSLFKGELGEKVAVHLANLHAEVTTYNRTDAAKLLNVARSTIYDYESQGLIKFRADGRISLAALLELQRGLSDVAGEDDRAEKEVNRKSHKQKRRVLKS